MDGLAPTASAATGDLLLGLGFVLIGRGSHREAVLAGAWTTLWPFAVGLVLGWLLARFRRAPTAVRPTGLVVWISTVVVGMLLRVASGQGVQVSFVVVATIVLAVFLLGWRLLTALVRRARARAV